MNSLASEWLVLNRPQLAGFHSPGDSEAIARFGEGLKAINAIARQLV